MDSEKSRVWGLSITINFMYTATLLFSHSSSDLDVQEPSNIQRVLLDAVKRGNVVKVSSVIMFTSQFMILQGSARPEVRSELYEKLRARI